MQVQVPQTQPSLDHCVEGDTEGMAVGGTDGAAEGLAVWTTEGDPEGLAEGYFDGTSEGMTDGAAERLGVGSVPDQDSVSLECYTMPAGAVSPRH
jgi:hypothetical protein